MNGVFMRPRTPTGLRSIRSSAGPTRRDYLNLNLQRILGPQAKYILREGFLSGGNMIEKGATMEAEFPIGKNEIRSLLLENGYRDALPINEGDGYGYAALGTYGGFQVTAYFLKKQSRFKLQLQSPYGQVLAILPGANDWNVHLQGSNGPLSCKWRFFNPHDDDLVFSSATGDILLIQFVAN